MREPDNLTWCGRVALFLTIGLLRSRLGTFLRDHARGQAFIARVDQFFFAYHDWL